MIKFNNACDGAYDSIDVRFTKSCDNDCPFCIEKEGIPSLGKTSPKKMIDATIQSGIKEVLILGGEPFLKPKTLLAYVAGIRDHVDKIYITTSLPFTLVKEHWVCNAILDLIDGLNVSIQHYDRNTNNNVLRASSRHDRMQILENLNRDYADKIRVSINLSRSGINNWGDMFMTLVHLRWIGCKLVKINELQHASEEYISFNELVKFAEMEPIKGSPYSSGCQREYKWPTLTLDGTKIIVKQSCFMVEKSQKASFKDLIKTFIKMFRKPKNKFMVMYENGQLEYSWLKKEDGINTIS